MCNMKMYLFCVSMAVIAHSAALAEAAADKKELNDAMAQRAELMIKTHNLKERIDRAWSDKELTSPEIEKLRNRYQQLKFEMIEVREKLNAEVRKLPEIRKLEEEVADMQVKQKELENKIGKLTQENAPAN